MSSEKTITPGEGEKCQQEATSPVLTAERTEKPADHFGEANEMIPAKPASTVKTDLTVDVVDAVWVELRLHDGAKVLYAYSDEKTARRYNEDEFANGTARIVRIRSDAVDLLQKAVALLSTTIEATIADVRRLESRLAALEKPAPKPAARVVKAPKPPVYGDGDWLAGVQWEAKRWVSELTSQGFTVAVDSSTQH
jgi:hypothetical protein